MPEGSGAESVQRFDVGQGSLERGEHIAYEEDVYPCKL